MTSSYSVDVTLRPKEKTTMTVDDNQNTGPERHEHRAWWNQIDAAAQAETEGASLR